MVTPQPEPPAKGRFSRDSLNPWRKFTETFGGTSWTISIKFILSCVATSGLANILRFPYAAYKNGGGAFLFSYLIVIILIGMPLFYLEMAMGQFARKTPIEVWDVIPAFRGIGIAQAYASIATISYYGFVLTVTLFYFFVSFQPKLPWRKCHEEWDQCEDSVNIKMNKSHSKSAEIGRSSSALFYRETVIGEISNIDDGIGTPSISFIFQLIGVWIILGFAFIKSDKCLINTAYFVALFQYAIMLLFLIECVNLPGANDGINHLFIPHWSELLKPEVWYEAVVQMFFSLNITFGIILYLASNCDFHHNLNRDVCIITALDTLLGIMANVSIFSILGNVAYKRDKKINKLVKGELGMTLINYPEGIAKFSQTPGLVSALLFLTMFLMGAETVVVIVGCWMSYILDNYPKSTTSIIIPIACTCGFLSGIVYLTPGGLFIWELVDHYVAAGVLYFIAMFEVIGIAWIYGLENFCIDLAFMTRKKVNVFWRLCLGIITPLFLLIIFLWFYIASDTITHKDIKYPTIVIVIFNLLRIFGLILILIWMIIELRKYWDKSFKKMVKKAFMPKEDYGPRSSEEKSGWKRYLELMKSKDWGDMTAKEKIVYAAKVVAGMIKDDKFEDLDDSEEQKDIDLSYEESDEYSDSYYSDDSEESSETDESERRYNEMELKKQKRLNEK